MLMKKLRRAAGVAAAVLGLSMVLTACGGNGGSTTPADTTNPADTTAPADTASDSTDDAGDTAEIPASSAEDLGTVELSWLLDVGPEINAYDTYEEGPAVKYWMDQTWTTADGTKSGKVDVKFITPPAGNEQENFNTLMATAEYPEVMAMMYSSENAQSLYEQGIALDLTEYAEKYMPNYMQWMEDHPQYASQMRNDGKIIMLYQTQDGPGDAWGGFVYRRDWILKYGKKPETGEAFTGGWNADKTEWTDDIVFPSGNEDPVYISDWEWMFEIFADALKAEGVTDGYCVQNYYTGFYTLGEINSSFGGSWSTYVDDDGKIVYGGTEDGMRAYIECMNHWYEEGWMDPAFEEHSSDVIWFQIDTPTVFSGKVGLWYGLGSQCGNGLMSDDPLLSDIYVSDCACPINDVYGDASCQNQEPTVFYGDSLVSTGVVVTNKVDEEKLPILLTAIDYLYGHEGAMLRSWGFSDEMQAEIQDPFYKEVGLSGGLYAVETGDDGEEKYMVHADEIQANKDMDVVMACNMKRVIGMNACLNVVQTTDPVMLHFYETQRTYAATGNVTSMVTGKLTGDQSNEASMINNNILTYQSQAIPDFITGRADIKDDAAWEDYCDTIEAFGIDTYVGWLNDALAE